jgi:hypothetical protein
MQLRYCVKCDTNLILLPLHVKKLDKVFSDALFFITSVKFWYYTLQIISFCMKVIRYRFFSPVLIIVL